MTLSRFAVSIVLMVMIINVYSLIVKTLFGKIFKKRSGAKPRSSFSVALFRLAHQHQLVDAVRFPVLHGLLHHLAVLLPGFVERDGKIHMAGLALDHGDGIRYAAEAAVGFRLPAGAGDGIVGNIQVRELTVQLVVIVKAAPELTR